MAKVAQKLDELSEKWQEHLQRSDITQSEQQAYEHGLRLIEGARKVSPNKALRTVQNSIINAWGVEKNARDFSSSDMERLEHGAKYDAYRAMRDDI